MWVAYANGGLMRCHLDPESAGTDGQTQRIGTWRSDSTHDVSTATIARERIERLRERAREAAIAGNDDRARRYVRRIRRIAERNRLDLPREFTRFTCDRCDAYLRPGENARVRLQNGHVVVTCDCGEHARFGYRD
jgi:ribonuclease P protein subunit RPR2